MFSNKMKAGRNHMPTVHMMSKSVKLYLITSYAIDQKLVTYI